MKFKQLQSASDGISDGSNKLNMAANSIQKNTHEFQTKLTPIYQVYTKILLRTTTKKIQKNNGNKFFCPTVVMNLGS